jgi:hypothetical protein
MLLRSSADHGVGGHHSADADRAAQFIASDLFNILRTRSVVDAADVGFLTRGAAA